MKRALSLLFCLLLALSLLLSACDGNTPPDPDEGKDDENEETCELVELMNTLCEASSYTAELHFAWQDGSTSTMTHKKDGNATYSSAFEGAPAQYTENVSGVLYVYTEESGKWDYAGEAAEDSLSVFFSADSYGEKNDLGLYPMKAAKTPKGYENVALATADGGCLIYATITRGTESAALTIRLTDIGSTTVTLP